MKAAGFDTEGTDPGNSKNPEGSAVLPSRQAKDYENKHVTTGRKEISNDMLNAKNAFGTPELTNGKSYRSGRGSFLTNSDDGEEGYGSNSFGSAFTPDNRFSDASSANILAAQAVASLVAVSVLGKSLMDDVLGALDDTKSAPLGRGPFLQGAFGSQVDANTRALYHLLLGTTNSSSGFQRSYKKAVDRGISVMFSGKIKSLNDPAGKSGAGLGQAKADASSFIKDSPGFWLSVSRGILRNVDDVVEESASATLGDYSSMESLVRTLGSNKLIGFFKYLAQIGDISLTSGMGMGLDKAEDEHSFFNVDKLPDGPATRVGKSRSSMGNTATSLAWRGNALPSVYLLPQEILKATTQLGTGGFGTNPSKGMLASTLWEKTYMDASLSGEGQRIPSDVIERMENMLDSEYCPFYFHDIRTNEIVAFHAFLTSLSDQFQPQYTDVKGYGRMDPVQIYNSTTRSIGLSFVVAATSQEDFDEMWFKINKLITMVYPQYSKGTKVSSTLDKSKFIQPFSQVLKASPMIRLRVGDVVKSNYSKFNLARIFGVGTPDATDLKGEEGAGGPLGGLGDALGGVVGNIAEALDDTQLKIFLYAYGTPLALTALADGTAFAGSAAERMTRAVASQLLVNGFGNPILSQVIGQRLRDPDVVVNTAPATSNLASVTSGLLTGENGGGLFGFGYMKGTVVFLKPTDGKAYRYQKGSDAQEVRFSRPIRGMITGRSTVDLESGEMHKGKTKRTIYKVMVTDLGAPSTFLFSGDFHVNHSDLILDPAFMYNIALLPVLSLAGTLDMAAEALTNEAAVASGIPADTLDLSTSETSQFFSSYTNPIVKAFNSSRGRGLAGFIRRLSLKHIEAGTTWETDWNSRAPKFIKIELGFNPIHDIPPGLDSQGFNRAPIYNVGRVMEYVSGDPYDDGGLASKFKFRDAGAATFKSKKTSE